MKRVAQFIGAVVTAVVIAWFVLVVLRGGWLAFVLIAVFAFSFIRALRKS